MHKRGFTLIELLVVITIIGLLAAIVFVSLGSARAKGRDARRLSDAHQFQTALQLYINANNLYPASASTYVATDLPALVTQGFIKSLPSDPQPRDAAHAYRYCTNTNRDGYTVLMNLESLDPAVFTDKWCIADGNITSGSDVCGWFGAYLRCK